MMKTSFMLTVLFSAIVGHAQGEKPRDFTAGFKQFHGLGLPKVGKDAKYVRVTIEQNEPVVSSGVHQIRFGGNAWLLEEDDKKATLIYRPCTKIVVWKRDATAEKEDSGDAGMTGYNPNETRIIGSWVKADLEKDLEKINTFLAKMEKVDKSNRMIYGNDPYAELFLFAGQLASTGNKDAANAILKRLFALADSPKELIAGSLGLLAETRYGNAFRAFLQGAELKDYIKEIRAVQASFGERWKHYAGSTLLLGKLEEQVGKDVPEITGDGVTPEFAAFAKDLLKPMGRDVYSGFHDVWIVGESGFPFESPLKKLLKEKRAAIPFLIAMAEDQQFMRMWMTAHNHSVHYSANDMPLAEKAKQQYESMPRPITRGEFALQLLRALVPSKEEDAPKESSLEEIRKWYARIKDMSEVELVKFYLESDNSNTRSAVIQRLIAAGKLDTFAPMIEKAMLASKDFSNTWVMTNYLNKRGPKAKPFAKKMLARCNEMLGTPKADKKKTDEKDKMFVEGGGNRDWRLRQIKQFKTSLEAFLTDKGLKELLEESLDKLGNWNSPAVQALNMKMSSMARSESLPIVLEAAVENDDPGIRSKLISMVMYGRHLDAASEKEEKLDPKKHKDKWKILLNDKRDSGEMYGGGTVAVVAAVAIELLYADGAFENVGRDLQQLVALGLGRLSKLFCERGLARLDGKELPPLPSASQVTDEQKTAMVKKILESTETTATLNALSNAEILALAKIGAENAKLQKKLTAHAIKIGSVSKELKLPQAQEFVGKPLDRKMVEAIIEHVKAQVRKGKLVCVRLQRMSVLDGFQLAPFEQAAFGSMGTTPLPMVVATVFAEDTHGNAMWPVKVAKEDGAKKPDTAESDDLKEEDDLPTGMNQFTDDTKFWMTVDNLGKINPFKPCFVMVHGMLPKKMTDGAEVIEDVEESEIEE